MSDELELSPSDSGTQVVYRGRKLYSSAPIAGANARAEQLSPLPDSIILWQSPLLWYGLEALLRAAPESCWIIGVEAEPALRYLAEEHLPTGSSHRLTLVAATDHEIASLLTRVERSRYRRVVELTTSGAAMLHRSRYRRIRDLLDRQIQIVWQNRLTLSAMGRLWIRNLSLNLPGLMTAHHVQNTGQPIVVAGAGPSLDRSLSLLHDLRQHITLIAVDTALPPLVAAGLYPDIVVAVEAQLVNAYDFLPCTPREYTLLADLGSTPTAAGMHSRCGWFLSRHSESTILDRVAGLPGIQFVLPPLGSVGVTAVSVAMSLSENPFFLTGLDFAVVPGQTHARSAPALHRELVHGTRLRPPGDYTLHVHRLQAPSATGGSCETTLVLAGYAKELARTIGARTAFQIEPLGLPVGARPVGQREARELMTASAGNPNLRAQTTSHREDGAQAVELVSFVDQEIGYLEEFLSARPRPETINACDYLFGVAGYTGEPDRAPAYTPVRVVASYFRERWEVTRTLLNLPRS